MSLLDGRDMPSTYTPFMPDAQPGEPARTSSVAVSQMLNADGSDSDVYMLVEKSGQNCTIQFYDGGSNTIYTGTNSTAVAITLQADAAMDEAFTLYSVAGGLSALRFSQADGTTSPAAAVAAGAPPALVAVVAAAAPPGGSNQGATDILIGGPFVWNPPTQPSPISGGGTSFSGAMDLIRIRTDRYEYFLSGGGTVTIPQDIFGQPASGSIRFQIGVRY